MIKLISFGLILGLFVISCVQKTKSESPAGDTSSGPTVLDVTQNALLGIDQQPEASEWITQAREIADVHKKRGWGVAVDKACSFGSENLFCQAMNSPIYRAKTTQNPKDRRFSLKDMRSILLKSEFEKIETSSITTVLKASQKFSKQNLYSVAEKIQESETCFNPALSVGIGASLEEFFPEPEAVRLATSVYKKGMTCGEEEYAGRAAYRLGLLNIWLEKNEEAPIALDAVIKNTQARYLAARAFYWKSKFEPSEKSESAINPDQFYQQFPLSFHSIKWTTQNARNPATEAFQNVEPSVAYRTQLHQSLNYSVTAAESFLKVDSPRLAKLVLDRLNIDLLHESEIEFRVYAATLFSRLDMVHATFRALSVLFSQAPRMKTKTTLSMFYPYAYLEETKEHAKNTDLDPFLILSLIRQESGFNPETMSPKGARGLMQLMPLTARRVKKGVTKRDLFKPDINLEVGIRFFNSMVKRYDGNVPLALAAYNAGPLAVDKWLKRYPTQDALLFLDLIPYRETREYVASILRNWFWYRNLYDPEKANEFPPVSGYQVPPQR